MKNLNRNKHLLNWKCASCFSVRRVERKMRGVVSRKNLPIKESDMKSGWSKCHRCRSLLSACLQPTDHPRLAVRAAPIHAHPVHKQVQATWCNRKTPQLLSEYFPQCSWRKNNRQKLRFQNILSLHKHLSSGNVTSFAQCENVACTVGPNTIRATDAHWEWKRICRS